jgi:VPDSG-CTERM motif
MKTPILAAIRCSLMFTAVTASLFSIRPAQAYTVTLEQIGSNVVANGSGPINLTGLTFQFDFGGGPPVILPDGGFGTILTGPGSVGLDLSAYTGFTGPQSFGSGFVAVTADTGSGDNVGIFVPGPSIIVPAGYVSGTALWSSATWNNASFASLRVMPGTYVWSWGTGLADQNFTLIIGGAGVPDGGSTVSLLGCALLGLAALRRKLSC